MTEHKFASLLRMAADNADQRFECGEDTDFEYNILSVLNNPDLPWRPIDLPKKTIKSCLVEKPNKTIKRWLWSDDKGIITVGLHSEEELNRWNDGQFTIKLLWSETEFEVDDD